MYHTTHTLIPITLASTLTILGLTGCDTQISFGEMEKQVEATGVKLYYSGSYANHFPSVMTVDLKLITVGTNEADAISIRGKALEKPCYAKSWCEAYNSQRPNSCVQVGNWILKVPEKNMNSPAWQKVITLQ